MSNDGSIYYSHLLKELITIPGETEWIEFKMNNQDPQEIGEYISALANTAALYGKSFGYIIWGIEDSSHNIMGTNFSPKKAKKGNEELENWLFRLISPKINFFFHEFNYEGLNIVILEINRAITN
ncbi:MAG: ATP-binding protein, partial [Spirochaetales bacterium]|nr:ATP-binding protein [Spirochaetales bacterium]